MASQSIRKTKVSTTDPDSTYLSQGNRAAELGYFDNYIIPPLLMTAAFARFIYRRRNLFHDEIVEHHEV